MHPSEFKSVQVFQEKISEHLPQFREKDVSEIFNTLQLAVSGVNHDSVLILKKELLDNAIEIEPILSDLVTELAEYILQHPDYSDPIIDLIKQKDLFSFSEKLEDLKDLELTFKRMERKRLKDELIKFDEVEEAEEIRQALMRNERKELKQRLKLMDEMAEVANYSSDVNYSIGDENEFKQDKFTSANHTRQIWLKVAAILVVVLIPLGGLYYYNLDVIGSKKLASNNRKSDSNTDQVQSIEDLDALIAMNLPNDDRREAIVKVYNWDDSENGYAREDEEIKITLISKKNQIVYLEEKIIQLESKIKELETQLNGFTKTGVRGRGPVTKEFTDAIDKLEKKRSEFLALISSIVKTEMHYEFDGKELKIYSTKIDKANRFSVESRFDMENDRKKEYFLLLDGDEYTKLKFSIAKK